MRVIHGVQVHGSLVDDQTRCAHYNSALDIIAIRFKCCGRWYPCRECHDEREEHEVQTWPQNEFTSNAILCGTCGHRLTIAEYFNCANKCPSCQRNFNPGCTNHYHHYFDVGDPA
jgi:uncharacterized CHY-type Zn-finger protein